MQENETLPNPGPQTVVDRLRERVTPQQFDTWFRRLAVHRSGDSTFVLLLPNEFIRHWIQIYYSDLVSNVLKETYGSQATFELAVQPPSEASAEVARERELADTPTSSGSSSASSRSIVPAQPRLSPNSDTILHGDFTFSNFVVGASNRFAHAAAVAVADGPGTIYNPFFLHGSVGLGKTHLLQAICHEILKRSPQTNILYLSCESFTNQFIEALEQGDLNSFRQKYRNVDVLLVDDIQLLANKERTQEEFFHTFNTLYHLSHQIVLSSDAPPKDIPTLQERLVSRFKMGLVVEIAQPDFETRVNILRNKARLRGHDLPTDVAHYLAENILTNIRELEGAIVRLVGYSDLEGRELSLSLAKEVYSQSMGRHASVITIHDIISAITKYYNVKLSDLQSKKRNQSLTFPRQVCMYLARKHTNHSLEEIGGYFGGRDHTTVLYATDKIQGLLESDPRLQEAVRTLTRELRL